MQKSETCNRDDSIGEKYVLVLIYIKLWYMYLANYCQVERSCKIRSMRKIQKLSISLALRKWC